MLFWWAPPIIEVIAAARAAVKLGSAAMAAVAVVKLSANEFCCPCCNADCDWWPNRLGCISWDICRPEDFDWLWSACPRIWGSNAAAEAVARFWGGFGNGTWNWIGCFRSCRGLGFWVRSNVTVGNGAEADMVARLEEHGRIVLVRKSEFISPSVLDMEPDNNTLAADDVVDAIAVAAGGKGWLWLPSYVVVRMVRSSAHLCTCSSVPFQINRRKMESINSWIIEEKSIIWS